MSNAVHVCVSAGAKCYAPGYSYGEICVGCGCCGKPGKARNRARLRYWRAMLHQDLHFDSWMADPKWRAVQEENKQKNVRHCRNKVRRYQRAAH